MDATNANTAPHSNRFELQPWHIVTALGLGACVIYPGVLVVLIPCGLVGWAVWSHKEKERIVRENAARLTGLVNLCAPVVVPSMSITEDIVSLMERVEQWKRDIRDSGNPYAAIIPVIPYPYQPMMFGVGQLSWAWPIYQRMIGEEQHTQNLKWYEGDCPAQLKGMFASQVMPAPKIETN